jgi:hypothetical protein
MQTDNEWAPDAAADLLARNIKQHSHHVQRHAAPPEWLGFNRFY